jgi:cell division protein FtsA
MVDYEDGIKEPVGMSGVRLEADFHIITAQPMRSIISINVSEGGHGFKDLILEPLASSLAVLNDEEKEAGVCLIDIGGGTTDIAIFYDNIIRHTAVIPFGGNIVTNDIKQGLMVLPQQAEQLKTRFGKAIAEEASPNELVSIPGIRNRAAKEISVKNLSNIIQAEWKVIEMAHTEIINSGFENGLAGGIVITSGGLS